MFNIFIDKIYENWYKKFLKRMEQKYNTVFLMSWKLEPQS